MDLSSSAERHPPVPLWLLVAGSLFVAVGLIWFEQWGPGLSLPPSSGALSDAPTHAFRSGRGALQLVVAAIIGALISAVHRQLPGEKPISRSLSQAQILLCVAGALMMIIIGNSFARALGVAGGATIIRFRTNVDDPKDSTVLFLLLGLGMACGIGEFGVAGLGTAFLCVCMVLLEWIVERKPRSMMLEMEASGHHFPTEYVNRILAAYQIRFESREVNQHAQRTTVRYYCTLDPDTPLQRLSEQLTDAGADGLKSVSWETEKMD